MIKIAKPFDFFLIGTVSLVVGWRPLMSTFGLRWGDNQYTYILLILPIAATLSYLDSRPASTRQEPRSLVGILLLVSAAATFAFSKLSLASLTFDVRLTISMLALVGWWIGAFVFCFDIRVSRSLLLPLFFLFGLIPLPRMALDEIVRLLQEGSAIAARLLFGATGVPVAQNGVVLTVPGLSIEIG